MAHFSDKVVWITGASSGIGEALAYTLSEQNAKLVLSARRKTELDRVKANCKNPNQVLVLPLDLLDHESMPEKANTALQHFGRIDALINNGGISQRSKVLDTDMSVYKQLMDVNYLGTVALTKAVLPIFVKQKSGKFGVMSSLMGRFASPLRSGYCGAKHALHGFFESLRMEYQDDGVEVTMICPGYIRTNISLNALQGDGKAQKTMDSKTDAGLSPEECARQIINAMGKGKHDVLIGGKETWAVYLKRFFPGILHNVVRKSQVT